MFLKPQAVGQNCCNLIHQSGTIVFLCVDLKRCFVCLLFFSKLVSTENFRIKTSIVSRWLVDDAADQAYSRPRYIYLKGILLL